MKINATRVAEAASRATGVPLEALYGRNRRQEICIPRQAAWHVAHERYGCSFPVIARVFKRDHTTVLQGVRRILALAAHDPGIHDTFRAIIAEVEQSPIAAMAVPVVPPAPPSPKLKFERDEARRARNATLEEREDRNWFQRNNDRFVAAMREVHPEVEIKPWLGVAPRRAPAVGIVA